MSSGRSRISRRRSNRSGQRDGLRQPRRRLGGEGDSEKALADLVRAVNVNPNSTRALAVRGFLYRKKGDLDRAIVDYGEMIRIDPKSDEAYMRRSEPGLQG